MLPQSDPFFIEVRSLRCLKFSSLGHRKLLTSLLFIRSNYLPLGTQSTTPISFFTNGKKQDEKGYALNAAIL